tara:strand:- start:296 stop:1180 length:885 start_codon:yes stop_codon:yes gene_type:complete
MNQKSIVVFASGDLGAKLLHYVVKSGYKVKAVLTNKHSTAIIDFTKKIKLPIFIGNPNNDTGIGFIKNFNSEIMLSVNYIFLVKTNIFGSFDFPINIHGSLLPKYRGRTPHIWAIINNEKETGITSHFINEGCDEGDIIFQKTVPIGVFDTGASILVKFERLYPTIIDKTLHLVDSGKLHKTKQNHSVATFFGKRVPEDGEINWNWQKEQIYNWVRALAYPYPGAFSTINNIKFIIDQIEFDQMGFNYTMKNGLILSLEPFLIKTPNGVIKIVKYREGNMNELKIGDILRSKLC